MGLAAATITAIGISGIRGILAPTLLTLILTICAAPVRAKLIDRGVPRGLATGSVIVVVFGVLAAFGYAIVVAVGQFAAMLPSYSEEFAAIGAAISGWLTSLGFGQSQVDSIVHSLDPQNVLASITTAIGGLANFTAALVIVLTMMILMAADAVYSRVILGQLRETSPDLVSALGQYAANVRRYMVVTTGLGIAQGALDALALALLGVPAALLWGLLAFLCSFIPNVGYFLALIPPLVFGFLEGGWGTALAVLVVYAIINAVVQSIIQPRVVGHAVSLSQTVTFFSVLFWAVIIGPIGAILAIPLTLFAKTVLIDADPDARRWQPALGPTAATRELMDDEIRSDSEHRRARHAAPATAPPVDQSSRTDLASDGDPPGERAAGGESS
ncbi:hypothetical protein ASC59_03680 [Leifsonia sp. Root1293]|nr:hypothetical protein ASC59_03680 [Leifsonia sp. Root1293]KRA11214.1 hypothetical protein ASD61_03680 [Leifsonia sp. Root60]